MSKWAYFCCVEDLDEYKDGEIQELLEWNKEAEEEGCPIYKIFNTKEEALAELNSIDSSNAGEAE